ncbi:MAG TPA: hypothetical protein VFY91_02745 [Microbacterium sp.]|nr:hypothetical protein [Microbacterium sp.]
MNNPEENTENMNGPEEMGADTDRTREQSGAEHSGRNSTGADNRTENPDAAPAGGGADRRPLGFWLRVVDARLTREFHGLLEADGLDRRDWMILNAIAGTVDRGPLAARLERGGRRLRALVDRGWVTGTPGAWALTDEGRAAFERIGADVAGFRARVAGAVSPEDFATTLSTLEAIAAELGEGDDGFGGFGRGRRGGRRPGHGHHPHHGHAGHGHHPHHGHAGHGCHHGGPESAHRGAPTSGHRRGHGHDRGSEGAPTPSAEV